jgi:general secretion pathway protein L
MNLLRQSIEALFCWFDSVAATINSFLDRMQSLRHVQVIEEERDTFTLRVLDNAKNSNLPDHRVRIASGSIDALPHNWEAILRGSRIELVLQPSRFLFRPLELPKRAAEYLDGIVRSQIDRLTPWTASEAVYGWTTPIDVTNDRVRLMIAATARAMVTPYLRALAGLNPVSIAVATVQSRSEPQTAPIRLLEQRMRAAIDVGRIRSILMVIFLLTGLSAAISIGATTFAADNLGSERQELLSKISARKAAMRRLSGGSVLQALEKRKQTTPSSVIVLEALSRLLPDDTYVTELRIEAEKVQIVGSTNHAPALIQLIEQSPHFAHATFFAPTTQLSGTRREQFHIEVHVNPVFAFGS